MNRAQLKEKVRGPANKFHGGVHWALPFLLAFVGFHLGSAVQDSNPIRCNYTQTYLPDPLFVVVGLAGLVFGRFLSLAGTRHQEDVAPTNASKALGQWAMVCLFALLTVIWFYEAIGTAHVSATATGTTRFEPITFYIRCAIYHDKASTGAGWWTIGVIFLICSLAGHWLWGYHPEAPGRKGSKTKPPGVSSMA